MLIKARTPRVLFLISVLLHITKFSSLTSVQSSLPLVINTWAFTEANTAAWRVLNHKPGGNALDALVEGCATCERLQCDGTVGFGGSPDENGETTLDAMVMDGSNMNIGAVAGLLQIKNAIGVARYVLEHTRHTLLVGEAASNFAEMMGFPREPLSTPQSKAMWKEWRNKKCQPNFWLNVQPDASKNCGPYSPLSMVETNHLAQRRYEYKIGPDNHDTIGMIVIDAAGQIYAGTSTNGARHKIPGRVGDSPIPGAGAYADNEVGAAVATGDGDVMMRFLPALLAVEALRGGKTPEEAAEQALKRIARYYKDFSGGLVVSDRYGNYSAACVGMKQFPFSVANGNINQGTRVEYKECMKTQGKETSFW